MFEYIVSFSITWTCDCGYLIDLIYVFSFIWVFFSRVRQDLRVHQAKRVQLALRVPPESLVLKVSEESLALW